MKLGTGALIWAAFQLAPLSSAHADIYALDEEDGTVMLSNLRTNRRSVVLIREEAARTGVLPAPGRGAASGTFREDAYQQAVQQAAHAYGVDSALLHAVIKVESSYRAEAVSEKGAVGLMQLMPGTARRYGVTDSFDPVQNLRGGAQYLRDLLSMFKGDLSLALAAYNAGENAVIRAGHRIPQYQETRNYVQRVQSLYAQFKSSAVAE